jgi:ABC-2 type transport system permease protein
VLIVAKTIGNTLLASLTLVVSWLTAGLLFRLTLVVPHPIVFLGAMVVTIIGFVAISIPISYLMLLSRKTGLYMNVLDIPVTLLCGFVFPLNVLPQWTQPISQALVPTWSTRLLHLALQPTIDWAAVRTTMTWNAGLILLYGGLTVVFWHAIQLRVRRNATLEVSE